MITPLRVWLDDMPLDALSSSIWIVGIDEEEPDMNIRTEKRVGEGTTFLSAERQSMNVTIRFQIESTDLVDNVRTMSMIQKWCRGGRLKTSVRPGLFASVKCSTIPSMTSLKKDEEYEIGFTAYENPYWQSEAPLVVAAMSKDVFIDGTAETALCEGEITNKGSSTCNTLTIFAGNTKFAFDSLGLVAGEKLVFDHGLNGYLNIRIVGTDGTERSAYGKRTPASDDELLVKCGESQHIEVTASGTFDVRILIRGRWL